MTARTAAPSDSHNAMVGFIPYLPTFVLAGFESFVGRPSLRSQARKLATQFEPVERYPVKEEQSRTGFETLLFLRPRRPPAKRRLLYHKLARQPSRNPLIAQADITGQPILIRRIVLAPD